MCAWTGTYSTSQTTTLDAKCGVTITTTGYHEAWLGVPYLSWAVNLFLGISLTLPFDNYLPATPYNSSQATGHNATCIAPMAHFSMSSSGDTENDGGTLTPSTTGGASVSFSSTSDSGSAAITSYAWTLDGVNQGGGTGMTKSLNPGSHTVTLTVTNGHDLTSAAASGTIQVAESCDVSDSGAVTRTVTGAQPSFLVAGKPQRPRFNCGQSGPPGGTSSPPSDPEYGCHWERDYVLYTDGTWDWLDDWQQVCGWEELRGDATSRDNDPSDSRTNPAIRVRFVGAGPQRNGRVATIARLSGETAGAEIVVDTTRATAADIENAIASAQVLIDAGPRPGGGNPFAVIGDAPAAQRNAVSAQGSAAGYLHSLLAAPERANSRSGKGRTLEIAVERRNVHVVRHVP